MVDLFKDIKEILDDGSASHEEIQLILEDNEDPRRQRTIDKLYASVKSMSHIDFGDIARSKGDIRRYSGIDSMAATLGELDKLDEGKIIRVSSGFASQVTTVLSAVDNIARFTPEYSRAFSVGCIPIQSEYNCMVAACVEATTALLYTYIDYTRDLQSGEVYPVVNTKKRGGEFYIDQLRIYNNAVSNMPVYRKYLNAVIGNGKENFLGSAFVVGSIAIVGTIALTIVPLTRKLLYTFQDIRRRLTEELELQAYYLELNETILKAKETMDPKEKEKILKKQAALRLKFLRLADKLRVESQRNQELSKKVLEQDNGTLTIGTTTDEINDDDFGIL